MPSDAVLELARFYNPHGVGFCSPSASYKGLSYPQFKKRVKQIDPDEPILMHFRYATHGSIKRSNCHPFFDKCTDTFFMHNGTLRVTPYRDTTDSETFFRGVLVPNIIDYGFDSARVNEVIYNNIGASKFAMMHGDEVKLYGQWYERNGIYYSNTRIF